MTTPPIDLRSETVTQPTPAMLDAMATAPVGDDVYGEDPTVARLEAKVAELAGKQAAMFVPSGTMGNLIAVLSHCGRGDEIFRMTADPSIGATAGPDLGGSVFVTYTWTDNWLGPPTSAPDDEESDGD